MRAMRWITVAALVLAAGQTGAQGRAPNAADRLSARYLDQALVLPMPQGAEFELLTATGDLPVCGVSRAQGGGLAILWRGGRVGEYGCWLSLEKDGQGWVNVEMNSGIGIRMPMRAFNKRPPRD